MKLETLNKNAEFYIASLALGVLEGMQQGIISPEAGIWSLARPSFSNEVLKSTIISDDLKYVIACFDEIDALSSFDGGEGMQQQMINELKQRCLSCLQGVDYKNIDMKMTSIINDEDNL
ncbi:hypothetical protein F993_00659 [Acinetobacter proteolyticus]|jgi:hypothetical protein|uniref:DUF3969 domain-containing protein n=1 Tax=Acinetobacter proteolyticus TaxID=1776741 RepID=A0A2N0WBL5_9GAMM|nr:MULTISPECIES: hypothetical protein [Acinetobacter]ENU24418.1 hypothetical protein F993_00659 [Acinetobacter proteolyticus]ESK53105.1 hypothetical protein F987_01267 [Acinetobacter gyllenbergii NIPH 230]PKF31892.1 hypothetical protein CW311_16795 [Acinetobacter proteolyticus]QHH94650.1 hypothetical protein FPL18_12865 [Acinetobacter gyllenbergii]WEI18574.1 hypothetical protein PY247_20980 [Acinetobacter proteolyticus]